FLRRAGVRLALVVVTATVGLTAVAVAHASAAQGGVRAVRLGGNGAETRIVIDLDRSASGKVSASGSDGRVVLTLAGVDVEGTLQGGGRGVVRNYILDQSGGGARLRVDLNQDAVIKRRFLLPPAD